MSTLIPRDKLQAQTITDNRAQAISDFVIWLDEQGLRVCRGAMPQDHLSLIERYEAGYAPEVRRAAKVYGDSRA